MENITVKDLLEATGGRLLCGSEDTVVEHICIDSRNLKGNDLFVPFIGEKVDAHKFVGQVLDQDLSAASLSSREDIPLHNKPIILIEDSLKALQAIGRWYRKNRLAHLKIVGVTGSVGKTSTREMVSTALSAGKDVFSTKGNFNGQIGVPLTLSQMSSKDEMAVLEMGMSLPGEMEIISNIACVDMAVVTNIGISHIENLGSQEAIRSEKLHILDGMNEGGTLILNGDDPLLADYTQTKKVNKIYYGTTNACRYQAMNIRTENNCAVFEANCDGKIVTIHLKVPGVHNVLNTMAALAVAMESGVDLDKAVKAIEGFEGFDRRLQILTNGSITIIDDAYNASPDSMRAALQVLDSMKCEGKKVAVLADMLELGPDSPRYHFEVGSYAVDKRIDEYVFIGELASWIGRAIDQYSEIPTHYFSTNDKAADYLCENLKPSDMVLFKGSNGMNLKEIIQIVKEKVIE
ncbi:UDP-N-acetylmuramoylalanyl-D-glutamyl-2,6- diaminopimelate--D-alanyl-D-alanine ligase [Lachnospiraceae bacterium TWA4]|nr:UDP-N-acetylmuramoylalanyl-D-glutamyl-2,6- diaminopimelate--D-alanyl-D-alanine ligase [Lachnospiraceae bacterium TWA4]